MCFQLVDYSNVVGHLANNKKKLDCVNVFAKPERTFKKDS